MEVSMSAQPELIAERTQASGGYFRLHLDGDYVRAECRWLFDGPADDWIKASCAVPLAQMQTCASNMEAGRGVRVEGVGGGSLLFEPGPAGKSRIEITDAVDVAPRKLALLFPENLAQIGTRFANRSQSANSDPA